MPSTARDHTNFLTGATIAEPMIDLIFTGFSKSRGTATSTARLDPAQLMGHARHGAPSNPSHPSRRSCWSRNNRVYISRHLEWMTSPLYRTTASGRRFVFPRIWRRPAGSTTLQLITPDPENATHAPSSRRWATGTWRYDQEGTRWIYDWKDAPTAYGVGNTITIYPLAGQVVFAKPLNPGDEIYAGLRAHDLARGGLAADGCFAGGVCGYAHRPGTEARLTARVYASAIACGCSGLVSRPRSQADGVVQTMPDGRLPRANQPGTEVTVTDEFGAAITQFTIDTGVNPTTGRSSYQDGSTSRQARWLGWRVAWKAGRSP